jgi:hypothetical protein
VLTVREAAGQRVGTDGCRKLRQILLRTHCVPTANRPVVQQHSFSVARRGSDRPAIVMTARPPRRAARGRPRSTRRQMLQDGRRRSPSDPAGAHIAGRFNGRSLHRFAPSGYPTGRVVSPGTRSMLLGCLNRRTHPRRPRSFLVTATGWPVGRHP